jgi:hypothetical protein
MESGQQRVLLPLLNLSVDLDTNFDTNPMQRCETLGNELGSVWA